MMAEARNPSKTFAENLRFLARASTGISPHQREQVEETCQVFGGHGVVPRRILIVEDNELIGRSTATILRCHHAVPVSTVDEAIEALESEEWDGVLWDVDLGAGLWAGLKLLKGIRRRFPSVLIQQVSGHGDLPDTMEKPVTGAQLRAWAESLPVSGDPETD
ncbi:response regulator [Candidatus Woesearchaeota archaeon]|jgi:CheY-like chemotaxis protein|nr:response regulator [Candidatus Woesearchaeota archaeon]